MQEIYTLSFLASHHHQEEHRKRHSSPRWGRSLGALHLTLGLLSVVLGILGLFAEPHAHKYGGTLWCGLVFETTGASGVIAGRKWYSRSHLKGFCAASFAAAFTAILLLALTCVGVVNHYVHFDPAFNVSVANYTAKVSANLIVLSLLEMSVCAVSVAVSLRAMRWRHRPPPPLALPVLVRETFMDTVPSPCATLEDPRRHHYVTVPDVLLKAVMPSVFSSTRIVSRDNSQILNAGQLNDAFHVERYLESQMKEKNQFSSTAHDRNY